MQTVLFAGALAGGMWYMSTLQPNVQVNSKGQYSGNSVSGAHDIEDTTQGDGFMPVTHVTTDVDGQTGLPIMWIHHANNTKSRHFLDRNGRPIATPHKAAL
jgi:hypothetical protein